MLTLEVTKPVVITPIDELVWPSESSGFTPSVLTIETSVEKLPSRLRRAGDSRWEPRILANSIAVYDRIDKDKPESRGAQIRWCRTGHWFVCHEDTREVRLATNSCKLRWCPKCARARANEYAYNVSQWCETFPNPKFLTLTQKHTTEPLLDQVNRLYKSFRKLRHRKEFREYVWGGVWGLHVKRSANDGLWHPHLHCLIHAAFYPWKQLGKQWQGTAPGNDIVWIQPVRDSAGAAQDIAGYAATPCNLSDLSLDDSVTVVETLHGRRICGAWGTAKGVTLRSSSRLDKDKWHNVGSLSVVQAFYNQDPNAKAIVNAWLNETPLEADVDMCKLDAFTDDGLGQSWNDVWSSDSDTRSRSPPRKDPNLW